MRTPGGAPDGEADEVPDSSCTSALWGGQSGSPGGIGHTCGADGTGLAALPAAHEPSTRNSGVRSQEIGFTLAGTRSLLPLPPLPGLALPADAPASSMAELASTDAFTRLTRKLKPPAASSDAAVAAAAAGLLETTVGSKLRTALLSSTETESRPAAGSSLDPLAAAAACSSAAAISSAAASETRKPCGCQPDRGGLETAPVPAGEVKRKRAAAAAAADEGDGDGAVLIRSVGAGFVLPPAVELPLRALAAGAAAETAGVRCAGRGERAAAFAVLGLEACATTAFPPPAAADSFADAGRALLPLLAMRARAAAADDAAVLLAAGAFAALLGELAGTPDEASAVAANEKADTPGDATGRSRGAVSSGIEAAVATEAISPVESNVDCAAASASVAEPIV